MKGLKRCSGIDMRREGHRRGQAGKRQWRQGLPHGGGVEKLLCSWWAGHADLATHEMCHAKYAC